MHHQLAWSAITCSFPGASVFLGLSSFRDQSVLAQGLSFRKLRVFCDGAVRVRAAGREWLINYFALRDPSAVRIIPINQHADPGFEHARLMFSVGKTPDPRNAFALSGLRCQEGLVTNPAEQFAFFMTVGLPPGREEEVFGHTIVAHPDQDWEQIRLRLAELGCGDRPKGKRPRHSTTRDRA